MIHPNAIEGYQLMHDGVLALSNAEQHGVQVDVPYMKRKIKQLSNRIEYLEDSFMNSDFCKEWKKSSKTSVNINSGAQLAKFLYEVKGIEISKTTKSGKGSTDEEALQQLNLPELKPLLDIAKIKKMKDYLSGYMREQVDGVLHPFFNLHLVVTQRSSSDSPNFQNIPVRDPEANKIIRGAIRPRPGHQLVEYDFKGVEVSIGCAYHKDPTMIKYMFNPTSDMHGDMAAQIFKIDNWDSHIPEYAKLRQAAKNGFVFPEFYGDYYKNCVKNLCNNWGELPEGKWKPNQGIPMPQGTLSDHLISVGLKSMNAFTDHLQKIEDHFWHKRFKKYDEWKTKWFEDYQKTGYVDLLSGFRLSGIMDKKKACNYPIQGSAFHCNLWVLNQADKFIENKKLDSYIIGQIHDSTVWDMNPDEKKYVTEKMRNLVCEELPNHWKWINTPMNFDIKECPVNGSWADVIDH